MPWVGISYLDCLAVSSNASLQSSRVEASLQHQSPTEPLDYMAQHMAQCDGRLALKLLTCGFKTHYVVTRTCTEHKNS